MTNDPIDHELTAEPQPDYPAVAADPSAAADMADNLALLRDCRGALETLRALDKAGVLASLARQHGL